MLAILQSQCDTVLDEWQVQQNDIMEETSKLVVESNIFCDLQTLVFETENPDFEDMGECDRDLVQTVFDLTVNERVEQTLFLPRSPADRAISTDICPMKPEFSTISMQFDDSLALYSDEFAIASWVDE